MKRWGTRMPIALGKRSVSRGGCRALGISPEACGPAVRWPGRSCQSQASARPWVPRPDQPYLRLAYLHDVLLGAGD